MGPIHRTEKFISILRRVLGEFDNGAESPKAAINAVILDLNNSAPMTVQERRNLRDLIIAAMKNTPYYQALKRARKDGASDPDDSEFEWGDE